MSPAILFHISMICVVILLLSVLCCAFLSTHLNAEKGKYPLAKAKNNGRPVFSKNSGYQLSAVYSIMSKLLNDRMCRKQFAEVAACPANPNWATLNQRSEPLYTRPDDPRSEFSRDYNRILHCTAYRRLKRKTQVFFATENDHICTRIEHVNHVTAISQTIAEKLGLNIELTNAIAIGHDLGHAPFGHEGEKILHKIASKMIRNKFWHEKNSLWFVDNIETLSNPENMQRNLALTYAVRDGIVCHCGEIDQTSIKPRATHIELENLDKPGQVQPITWEGCVVKVADKIAFLGRDLEDAFDLNFLSRSEFKLLSKHIVPQLPRVMSRTVKLTPDKVNNTALIHSFILSLFDSSSPANGISFSKDHLELMKAFRTINSNLIYDHPRLRQFKELAKLVLYSLFDELSSYYDGRNTLLNIKKKRANAPRLNDAFEDWLIKYTNIDEKQKKRRNYENRIVYDIDVTSEYQKSILHFISGMTDSFALGSFDELTKFQ